MNERARARLVAELIEGGRRCAIRADCPRCGRPCVRGEDADMAALVVTVDDEPIDRADEMLAVLAGETTYDLSHAAGKNAKPGTYHLFIRQPWHYRTDRVYGTTHREHKCEEGKT